MLDALIALGLALTLTSATAQEAEAGPARDVLALLEQGSVSGAEFDAAAAALRQVAEAGDSEAMNLMGALVSQGHVLDAGSAQDWYLRAIEVAEANGDAITAASATVNLAAHYIDHGTGEGRARTLLEGLQDAPEEVRAEALGLLGADYLFGLDGEAREMDGRAFLNSAIARGYRNADVIVAYADFMRNVDPLRAQDLYAQAAQSGHVRATWAFAIGLLDNGGNPAQAYQMIEWASDQGLTLAKISRAVMLATGQGVELDAAEARAWYLSAAHDGSAHALRGLAFMVLTGEGGEADIAAGYGLADIAAEAGDEIARALLDGELEWELPARPSDAAVEAAAQSWLAEHGLTGMVFN